MTLARLWAFLAVALPVLAALIANLSDRRPDLPPARRRRDPRRRGAIPTRRHLDVHRGRPAVDGPAVGRPGHPGRRLPARPAGPGWCCSARRSSASSSAACSSIGRRRGLGCATRGAADAGGVRRRRGRPRRCGRSCSGWPCSRSSCCSSRTAATHPRPAVAGPARRRGLGEHPRQLLPRAARARAGLARGRPRPRSERPHRTLAGRRRQRARRPASRRSGRRSGPTPSGCRPTRA